MVKTYILESKGHYQKNNRLNVGLVKKRIDEEGINKIDIAI